MQTMPSPPPTLSPLPRRALRRARDDDGDFLRLLLFLERSCEVLPFAEFRLVALGTAADAKA
jgi:hypothetical protein